MGAHWLGLQGSSREVSLRPATRFLRISGCVTFGGRGALVVRKALAVQWSAMNSVSAAWCWINDHAAGLTFLTTVVATFVAGVYAWLTRKLWRETKEMVVLTRQVFEADHRPWLSIVIEWGTPPYQMLAFRLKNHGRAPAIVNDWSISVIPPEAGSPQNPGSRMSAVFPGESDSRPPIVFDDEFRKWDRHDRVVRVIATARYYWADKPARSRTPRLLSSR